jgi:PPOX class probable F420-dependent enzyme
MAKKEVFMAQLPERARELFDAANHAVVTTLEPDGSPQSSVVWVRTDGDDVLFSTIKGRRKYANLTQDPRLSVLVYAATDPYTYAEVRGRASITDDPEAELIEGLAKKYTSRSFGERPGEQRVIVRVTPDRVVLYD